MWRTVHPLLTLVRQMPVLHGLLPPYNNNPFSHILLEMPFIARYLLTWELPYHFGSTHSL